MKRIFISVAALLIAVPVYAGDRNDNSAGALSQSGSSSSVNINGGKSYRGVGAAIAPGLAVGAYSCSGSVSAGVGGSGFGIAFGSTVMDRDCNKRENAKLADVAFGRATARRVLCGIRDIAEAEPSCQPRVYTTARPSRALTRKPVTVASNGWGQRSN